MSGRKKLLAPENDFTKHTCATSIVKFIATPKHSEISFKGTKANQRPPEKATLKLTKFKVNSPKMKKKLKKSLKLTTHIFGAITDKLLSVWCC